MVKKYTNNLTIIYDGDGAGIKAALRGLDLALEESLNVRLVLIPDKEDPDSYVNKVGAAAFKEFIANNKKDFILFQLEIALQDVGTDTTKKAAVVNQVAETISKINKAEDFTKQQDYIKQSAELLKIEEGGLHALVNKFLRDKINKEENRQSREDANAGYERPDGLVDIIEDDALTLFNKDEITERAMVSSLLDFGLKDWDENTKIADYVFNEFKANDLDEMMDNKELLAVMQTYKIWYDEGIEPTAKNFLYYENRAMSALVVSLAQTKDELSTKWFEKYEIKPITREDEYKLDIQSTLNYLKLRKIKRLINDNQHDLEKATDPQEQMVCLQTHQHLKQVEMELTKMIGTVIFK